MQKILIVEDNMVQNEMLANVVRENYPAWSVFRACDYDEAVDYLTESLDEAPFTLFFLDIQLSEKRSDRGGFLLAEKIRTFDTYYRTPILFLTAVSDDGYYALSHFHCYNYITKPYDEKDILLQLEQMMLTGYLENSMEITDTNNIHYNIRSDDICYIESSGHVKTIYTKEGKIATRAYNMGDFEKLLDKSFIRCHKRFIINSQYITNIDLTNNYVEVYNTSIPIGRTYKSGVEQVFERGK